jgi:AraC-like DNA-binding protein
MKLSLINPHIRLAMQSTIPSGRNIARRVIYDYELIYLEKGEFTFIYDDKPYPCKSGDFILIRPGIPHSFRVDCGEISQPHIHFDITHRPQSDTIPISFKDIQAMTEVEKSWIHKDYFSGYAPIPFITVDDKKNFLDDFLKVIIKDTPQLIKKAIMVRLISAIIDANFPNILEGKSLLTGVEYQVKDYIDAGNGFEMSLDDFAKYFFQSKFYLDKKFKKAFGMSLIEYRNNKRMEFANQLLRYCSVTEVAKKLGFESIYSFSRSYKHHFGLSPSKYKRSDS